MMSLVKEFLKQKKLFKKISKLNLDLGFDIFIATYLEKEKEFVLRDKVNYRGLPILYKDKFTTKYILLLNSLDYFVNKNIKDEILKLEEEFVKILEDDDEYLFD